MGGITESLRDPRPGKRTRKQERRRVTIRPGSDEELQRWQDIARGHDISPHALFLYLIRKGMKELEAGQLTIEREEVTVTRVKMP